MLKRGLSVLSVLLLAFVSVVGQSSTAKADDGIVCQNYTIPVTLSAVDPTVYHVSGQLCGAGSLQGKTVQLLVHGFTYDHNYWDFPLQPGVYSYVRHAVDEGYATFNYDRIGSGLSDHPLSTNVSIDTGVYVLRQLVQGLRTGSIAGQSFGKVITVGHSAGSGIALLEASQYADVDGVILSAFLHQFNVADTAFFTSMYPANQDPKFTQANLDSGYLTTQPGTRGLLFYNTAVADPAVVAADELLKQTGTSTEEATSQETTVPTASLAVHVPVLLAIGQDDTVFCNDALGLSCADNQTILNREAADFSTQACLEAFVLTDSGHDINLHPNARTWFAVANDWANRRVGASSTTPASDPCAN